MAVVNPAPWLHNSGSTNTAQLIRLATGSAFKADTVNLSRLGPRGGVIARVGTVAFQCTQNGGGDMSVNVATGLALVSGTENSQQGSYWVANDASVNLAIAANASGVTRLDSVYVAVRDDFYSGVNHDGILAVATGTASPPTLPANAMELWRISVPNGASSILNANISDRRRWATAHGGITPIQSFESTEDGVVSGEHRWRTPQGLEVWDGTVWRPGAGMQRVTTTADVVNPQAGHMASASTDLAAYMYSGSAWQFYSDKIFKRKTADETVTSSTTLQNDDHLAFSLLASQIYEFHIEATYDNAGSATAGLKFGWATVPAGATMNWSWIMVDSGPAVSFDGGKTATDTGAAQAGSVKRTLHLQGLVFMSSTAGTVTWQWAQNVSNASGTIVRSGSYGIFTRMP